MWLSPASFYRYCSGRRVRSCGCVAGFGWMGPNLNHGQDTRANRTRHTTSSSTQPHANDANQRTTQSVISRSHPALTPPPALNPAPPLPFNHKYRVLAPGGYSIKKTPGGAAIDSPWAIHRHSGHRCGALSPRATALTAPTGTSTRPGTWLRSTEEPRPGLFSWFRAPLGVNGPP